MILKPGPDSRLCTEGAWSYYKADVRALCLCTNNPEPKFEQIAESAELLRASHVLLSLEQLKAVAARGLLPEHRDGR